MSTRLTASFDEGQDLHPTLDRLVEAGIDPADISLLRLGEEGRESIPVVDETQAGQGVVAGATIGGLLGALGAGLLATGVVAAPGLAVFASGPLFAALQGAVAGGAAGGLAGLLGGLGNWDAAPEASEGELVAGRILLVVEVNDERAELVRGILGADRAVRAGT